MIADQSETLHCVGIAACVVFGIVAACWIACYLAPDDSRKCDPYPDAWDEDGRFEEDDV